MEKELSNMSANEVIRLYTEQDAAPQKSNAVGDDGRQKLFNYMKEEHGVTLLDSDFNEIENIINPKKYPRKQ